MLRLKIPAKSSDSVDNYKFCQYLCKYIQRRGSDKSLYNENILNSWDEYFHSLISTEDYKKINSSEAIKLYFNNLVIINSEDNYYIIQGNNKIKYPETDLRLESIIKTITVGTLSKRGYPIINNIYRDTILNIENLYNIWRNA